MKSWDIDLFEAGYEKFVDFAKSKDLIPLDRNRVVIAYSGGKDASLLADFVLEFKKRERPDISIELLNVVFPRFIYDSSDPTRKQLVDEAFGYWARRGIPCTRVDAGEEFPDSILDGDNPCQKCALFVKPQLFGRQIKKREYENAVFCIGLTLDDAIGWFFELHLISGGRGDLWRVEKQNPKLYSLIMRLSIRITCRLKLEKNNLLYSRPLMAFNDDEIRDIVKSRSLPLIPEDCAEQQGRDVFVDSPRREICDVLSTMRKKYPVGSPLISDAIFANYGAAMRCFQKSGLIPHLLALENYLNDTL